MLRETLEGRGKLRRTTIPPMEFDVEYGFDIFTGAEVVSGHNMPKMVRAATTSRGIVRSLRGEAIPGGGFELETEDGETLRVISLGANDWQIVTKP